MPSTEHGRLLLTGAMMQQSPYLGAVELLLKAVPCPLLTPGWLIALQQLLCSCGLQGGVGATVVVDCEGWRLPRQVVLLPAMPPTKPAKCEILLLLSGDLMTGKVLEMQLVRVWVSTPSCLLALAAPPWRLLLAGAFEVLLP
jgi:hypothetical protein